MANKIGKEQLSKLLEIMKAHPTLETLCGIANDATEADLSCLGIDADCAITLADELPAKGALTSLNISMNSIGQLVPPDGWRAKDGDGQAPWIHTDGRELTRGMPEGSKPEGVIAISNAIPTMGALTSLNISNNDLGGSDAAREGLRPLMAAIKENASLKELVMVSNSFSEKDAPILADAISANGAMESLNISANNLGGISSWIAQPAKKLAAGDQVDGKLVVAADDDDYQTQDLSGVIALADGIENNGALTSLNIRYNSIGPRQLQRITALCKTKGIALDSEGNDPSSEYDEIADDDDY